MIFLRMYLFVIIYILIAGVVKASESKANDSGKTSAAETEPKEIKTKLSDRLQLLDKRNCITDQDAVKDVTDLKQELLSRSIELEKKESDLLEREKTLNEQLKKMDVMIKDILAAKQTVKASAQERVARLVETIESMSPKPAAQIMGELDSGLAIEALSQLSALKRAKILALLPIAKSTELSEGLAGLARANSGMTRRSSEDEAAAKK